MRVVKIERLNDGMGKVDAGELWSQIEAFAAYSFNLSHSCEYSLLSFWTMWLRVNYPAQYFAASMSIVKEDKLPGLVRDAREAGITVEPPDIQCSTDRYVIKGSRIIAPISAMLGASTNVANKLVRLRENAGGSFSDVDAFKEACTVIGSGVNARVVERLEKVGAFRNTPGGGAYKPDQRDLIEFLPGLIVDSVKSTRVMDLSIPLVRDEIARQILTYKKCTDCSLAKSEHPVPRMKNVAKFMVVFDCPTWEEAKAGRLLVGSTADFVKEAICEAGLEVSDGYYTTLVKAKKEGKFLSNDQINGCRRHFDSELELLKPPVIVALGINSVKRFLPSIKGGVEELAGTTMYDAKTDTAVVIGINPAQLIYSPHKKEILCKTFKTVAEIVG